MTNTVKNVLEFVSENDIKFIKLAFCDIFGGQKNISIMPDGLESAFSDGVPFDACAIKGFSDVIRSDLFLFPDPTTIAVLPYRPQIGRVARFYCDIKTPDGEDFECDTRAILKKAVNRASDMGFAAQIGSECEFYLFKTDENGEPLYEPFDMGGYLDTAPMDKGENVRREICLCLEEMGIKPESSHHEQGPGQNEIDFKFSEALIAADNLLSFKTVVKSIAARNGLYASFLPKPFENKSGNGLHINVSLSQNGKNIFKINKDEQSKIAESFIAGVLKRVPEMTAFLNPIVNSYERLGSFEAPKYLSWSHQNRSQLIRIPAAKGEKVRMELRSPDPSVNPYLSFALVINAGLDGIDEEFELSSAMDIDLYNADENQIKKLTKLPENLTESLAIAKNSEFVKKVIGSEILNRYIDLKQKEESVDKEYYFRTV